MKFTVNVPEGAVTVQAEAGVVLLNASRLMPHQAAILADALNHCAGEAQSLAADAVASLAPDA